MKEINEELHRLQKIEYKYMQLKDRYKNKVIQSENVIEEKDCLLSAYLILEKMQKDIHHLDIKNRRDLLTDLYSLFVQNAIHVRNRAEQKGELTANILIEELHKKYKIKKSGSLNIH